jgi:N-acetylmuramoyl-L-alanine amidase
MQLVRRGHRGPVVAEIRSKLTLLGLLPAGLAPDDVFDDACDRALRHFQQQRGLMVDGIVGEQTYRALDEARWRLGDRLLYRRVNRPFTGDDVSALQTRLLELGFDAGRVDGIFGVATATALREFQRNVGVEPDGLFGPVTIRAMEQLRRTVVGGEPARLREDEALHRAGSRLAGKVVIVDPSHGLDDPGWVVDGITEAAVTFDVAARLEGRFAAGGALPFLTRSQDGSPTDRERADFANAAEADLLLSLHCDGIAGCATAHGVSTYYFGSSPQHRSAVGERLAELVQSEIVARTDLLDGRTQFKTWELLRLTRMPAVRVDIGYLTNPGDHARLADPTFRDTVAEAIFVAIERLYLPIDDNPATGQLLLPALQTV